MISMPHKTMNITLLVLLLVITLAAAGTDSRQREIDLTAEKMFEKAQNLFHEKNYWDCSGSLIMLLDTFPTFSEIDHVVYMLGECLYETDMLDASNKIFDFFLTSHADSKYLPLVLSSMQRIYFDKGVYSKSLEIHKTLVSTGPETNVLNYSLYYAGLTHYYMQNYPEAIANLSNVQDSSPYWDNALYNLGLACLKNEQVREGIEYIKSVCRLPVFTPERQNLINEAHLTLGYLFYEMGHYGQSLREFKQVTSEYENYQTILLSSGWAATKMLDYKEAILHLTDYITQYSEDREIPQGLFLLGRCYIKLGYYEEALQSYDYLMEILPKRNDLPENMNTIQGFVSEQQQDIEKIKMDILMLESKFINDLALFSDNDVPEYIRVQQNELISQRQSLLDQIRQERQTLNRLNSKISNIVVLMQIREEQREWRAFAEYGKSRALFLAKQQALP